MKDDVVEILRGIDARIKWYSERLANPLSLDRPRIVEAIHGLLEHRRSLEVLDRNLESSRATAIGKARQMLDFEATMGEWGTRKP